MNPGQYARPVIEALEPRILYSADLAPGLPAIGAGFPTAEMRQLSPMAPGATPTLTEIAFVDGSLADAGLLVEDLEAQRAGGRAIDVVLIGGEEDGIQRITQILSGRTSVGAIHLFGHGTGGELQIGAGQIDQATLFRSADAIVGWSLALTTDADILLYGCDLAANESGVALLDGLAALTGADVAASEDATGSPLQNADWILEIQRGSIEASVALSAPAQQAWTTALATTQLAPIGDTYIDGNASQTLNYGLSTSLWVDESGSGIGSQRTLLLFDLSTIPTGATITNAMLEMQATQITGPFSVAVYEVTQSWSQGTGDGGPAVDGANWSQRKPGLPWTTQGGTFDPAPVGIHGSSGAPGQQTWGVTALAQAWYAGTKVNNGLLLGGTGGGGQNVTYDSSEGTTPPRLVITYTVANQAPVLTSNGGGASASLSVSENTTAVTTVTATDADGTTPTYALSGADAGRFTLNPTTGALAFTAAADYETPLDANGDNVYQVTVGATDGSLSASQNLSITVTNLNEVPVLTSNGGGTSASLSVSEDATAVTTVTATDADGSTPTYVLSGADAGRFTLNAASGALSFATPPNFEAPLDANGDNVYQVTVLATDGDVFGFDFQTLAITVTNLNEVPVLTSNGGGTSASLSVSEDATAVTTVTATDVDGTTPTYVLSGVDAGRFTLNAASGALTFTAAPDYETPLDANGDNTYQVTVLATDGSLNASQNLSITVTNLNEVPVLTSNGGGTSASLSVSEDATAVTTVTATDADGSTPTYVLSGADAGRFTLNAASGALTFTAAPDYETPLDANGDNTYQVTVGATDGSLSASQNLSITVTNLNEVPVLISNGGGASASLSVSENTTAVTTVTATDADRSTPTYVLSGADAGRFTLNAASGALTFTAAPDYETPLDANGDNTYQVTVGATDGSLSASQNLSITVTNLNEVPVLISNGGGASASLSVSENTTAVTTVTATDVDGTTPTYVLSGVDAGRFTLNAASGALTFTAAPDYETPLDADGDNVYQVTVLATDGSLSASQNLSITVTNLNEVPVLTSNGGGASASLSVSENTTAVTTVTATDADGTTPTYALSGADAGRFTLNPTTGALAFTAAADYETPLDANGDNVYQVTVGATDGSLSASQNLSITVTNLNEVPVLTSNGGGTSASLSVSEDATAVTTVTATDADGSTPTYVLSGVDAGRFTLNAASGALTFTAAPDYETPLDANGDNTYQVTVLATDGSLSASQNLSITVTNLGNPGPGPVLTVSDSVTITAAASIPAPDLPPALPVPSVPGVPAAGTGTGPAAAPVETGDSPQPVGTGDEATGIIGTGLLPMGPDYVGSGTNGAGSTGQNGLSTALRNGQATAAAVPETLTLPQMFGTTLLAPGELTAALERVDFLSQLDALRRSADAPALFQKQVAGVTTAASMSLTAGYVLWLLRGGALLASVVSSLPAWHLVDPLPVLRNASDNDDAPGDNADEVENVFGGGESAEPPEPPEPPEPEASPGPAAQASVTRQPGPGP